MTKKSPNKDTGLGNRGCLKGDPFEGSRKKSFYICTSNNSTSYMRTVLNLDGAYYTCEFMQSSHESW